MAKKEVTLEGAAFFDSDAWRRLASPPRAQAAALVGAFLEVCFDELGKHPRHLDDHDMAQILRQLLPRRLRRDDPLAEEAEEVLGAYLEHLEATHLVSHAYELRRAFGAHIGDLRTAVAQKDPGQVAAPRADPFVHGASKLGRNDPCSCGSGKKYKKCHGRKDG